LHQPRGPRTKNTRQVQQLARRWTTTPTNSDPLFSPLRMLPPVLFRL
jgi:hypothetical protein